MGKNIVIFADGTGKEGGKGANSNIYKLFNMIEDRTPRQISFYDRGLGANKWRRFGDLALKVGGLAGGAGISRNIKDCYRFIFENFESEDRIYLFGFSRGAATVRSLSGFIHYFGILPKSRPELIDDAYKIYETEDEAKRDKKAKEFLALHHNMWARIHFVGCFDTVSALGLPWTWADVLLNKIPWFHHKFHNFKLSETVVNAYHALAIDEERKYFQPVLWEAEVLPYQKVRQVWFCGMHSDVGGGYEEAQLSDIPLAWMLDAAEKHGLHIYRKISIDGDVNGLMHNSRGQGWEKFYPQQRRFWQSGRSDKPVVHHSVLKRIKNSNNEDNPAYKPWILKLEHEVEW